MKLPLMAALMVGLLPAQTSPEMPLAALPYTPSLDLASMDRSADPCVDFYRYACGGWIRNNPIPADQSRWDVYSKLQEENERFLWGMLQEAAKPKPGRAAVEQRIGDYFHACMDEGAIDQAGAKPLQPALQAIASLDSMQGLAVLVARLQLGVRGPFAPFGFDSGQDFADASRVIGFFAAGGLGLPDRDYYTRTDPKSVETRAKYLEHVKKMFELLGDSGAAASAEAKTVMAMETALAQASLTRVEKRQPRNLFHKMTRAQLAALAPAFAWDRYLEAMGEGALASLNVTEPEFFRQLAVQLRTRPLEDWKTYLRWHLVRAHARYLSSPFVEANFDFYGRYLRGIERMPPRWKRCVQYVDRDLGEDLGQAFVEKTFSPALKARTLAMTVEIQKAMEDDIHELTWMTAATKQQALDKLHSMIDKVGYPDRWRDYSPLHIARGDFYGDVERAAAFELRRRLARIGKPLDRGEWQMTPPTVNAYYDPQMNDINFPAGVLQPPLFDARMDDAPNYGNTGATIGHELTHGFDDEGRQFDGKGNLRDWWTASDAAEFNRRARCISDQYSQYTVIDGVKINGKLTLGEDVADLGGTLLAYMAWRHAVAKDQLGPADGFTPDQRFFIGMAQWACGNTRPEQKRQDAIVDPHSPNEYRINGVVANMPEFARAFECRVGQPMVRGKACRVW